MINGHITAKVYIANDMFIIRRSIILEWGITEENLFYQTAGFLAILPQIWDIAKNRNVITTE